MDRKRILVVDDEENLRHMLSVMVQRHGYEAELAANGQEALEKAMAIPFDFILCDIKMPVLDGPAFLDRAARENIDATIIMMSAYGTMETALDCMKRGAYDYISKPFNSDEILLVLKKAEERERLKAENRRLQREIAREYSFHAIVSRNPVMLQIFDQVRKVSDYRTTVLILGESGTGKELVARAIHDSSDRAKAPFIALNCGAIPENLLESELFGHTKGAFTDANRDKAGLFEQADKGTLFLDEIGEMPLPLQVKLLRVLQENEIRPIGGMVRKVDVRVISATSRNLEAEVACGRFREDLFYRLNVFAIRIPPLRERPEDITLLVEHFLTKHAAAMGMTHAGMGRDALRVLIAYEWPGNVRELENCIERSLILCSGETIDRRCLPDTIRTTVGDGETVVDPSPVIGLGDDNLSIKQAETMIERELIQRALARTGGNRTHAARLLEISLRSLIYKLKDYGLE